MKLDFCVACGAREGLHHHHLVPKAKGGTDDDNNFITLCGAGEGSCHAKIHNVSSLGGIRTNHGKLVKQGKKKAREEGRWVDSIPYGFTLDRGKRLVFHKEEHRVLEIMSKRRERGDTLSSISRWLNSKGHKGRYGGKWNHTTVGRVIKNGHKFNKIVEARLKF